MSKKSKERAARQAALSDGLRLASRPPRPVHPLPMARQCGTYSACCVVFQVPELDKRRGEPCQYLKPTPDAAGMCHIWDAPIWNAQGKAHGEFAGEGVDGVVRKPPVCRDFRCGWLQGRVPEHLYPPKSAVVIRPSEDGKAMQIFELVAGAARRIDVDAYIDSVVARGVPVIVIPPVTEPGGPEPNRRYITAKDRVLGRGQF